MTDTDKYKYLFRSGKLGGVTLKNRVVMSPMSISAASPSGEINDTVIAYYSERAKYGVGLIFIGMMTVDEEYGITYRNQIFLRATHVRNLKRLAESIHGYGAKVIGQLYHGGNMGTPQFTGRQNISASDVTTLPGNEPRAMTLEEIMTLEQKYVNCAKLLQTSGFDGVEIHAAHGYLIPQFLSPYYNKRTDQYGGSFENRFRLLKEIIEKVRQAVGPRFIITVRFSGDEMAVGHSPLHMTLEDGVRIAKAIEETGMADALNISNGNGFFPNPNCEPFSYPFGWKKHVSKKIKESVSLPIIATNTVKDPAQAEQLLAEGVSDFIALGRPLFADPQFLKKTWEGREDEIRKCLGCMHCRTNQVGGVQCAINPRLLREDRFSDLKHDGDGLPLAVVGAGPGGLQCAITLAERGFDVTLYEKESTVGGTLNVADKPPLKEKITLFVQTLEVQAKKAGVHIVTGVEAEPSLVGAGKPAAVFLATGGTPIIPKIPGIDRKNVYLAEQVLQDGLKLPGRVAVIGSGMTGLETAEVLAMSGSEVTIIEMLPYYGNGMFAVLLKDLMSRLGPFDPKILTSHMPTEVVAGGVIAKDLQAKSDVKIGADYVVLALGVAPQADLIESYRKAFGSQNVFVIGDAGRCGKIYDAISSAFLNAYQYDKPTG